MGPFYREGIEGLFRSLGVPSAYLSDAVERMVDWEMFQDETKQLPQVLARPEYKLLRGVLLVKHHSVFAFDRATKGLEKRLIQWCQKQGFTQLQPDDVKRMVAFLTRPSAGLWLKLLQGPEDHDFVVAFLAWLTGIPQLAHIGHALAATKTLPELGNVTRVGRMWPVVPGDGRRRVGKHQAVVPDRQRSQWCFRCR